MSASSLVPGQEFAGDFEIVRQLSAGGMGVVFVATQRSTGLARALKVMQPQLVGGADPQTARKNQERFIAEARIGASIPSEHVVQVIAAGIDAPTGSPWLAMELLQGETLDAELARRGAFTPAETCEVFEQVCHAVGAAHRIGVFHLDLKPENIFRAKVFSVHGGTTLKVLDFGIARAVSEHHQSTKLTQAIGTPYWMSPEQVKGQRASASADVWALGLIAFQLLTGRHYWLEAHAPETSLMAWINEMGNLPLPPASIRAAQLGVGSHLPTDFDAWFARCVVRERAERFSNATEAFAALRVALARDVAAHPVGPSAHSASPLHMSPLAGPTAVMTHAVPGLADPRLAGPSGALAAGTTAPPPTRNNTAQTLRSAVAFLVLGLLGGWKIPQWIRPRAAAPVRPRAAVVVPPAPPAPRCPEGTVLIPHGTFLMGSAAGQGPENERPQHAEEIADFCLDRTEVSVAAYRACTGCAIPTAYNPRPFSDARRNYDHFCNWNNPGREDHPINCVDWNQADAFCRSVGGRLPEEKEWEYAARGTDQRPYPWGFQAPSSSLLNACGPACTRGSSGSTLAPGLTDDGYAETAPVTAFAHVPSPFGAINMAGNVWEWTNTPYGPYRGAQQAAPGAVVDMNTRVLRGGSWDNDVPAYMRAAYRSVDSVSDRSHNLGFRCARGVL